VGTVIEEQYQYGSNLKGNFNAVSLRSKEEKFSHEETK
jgi:hypothetical protein